MAKRPNGSTKAAPLRQSLLESHPTCHHCCLREAETDPKLSSVERLALVRERARRIREIRRELAATAKAELRPNQHHPYHTGARRAVRATRASDH